MWIEICERTIRPKESRTAKVLLYIDLMSGLSHLHDSALYLR
jgi:hypothetical protein